jgi:hypothetical protein
LSGLPASPGSNQNHATTPPVCRRRVISQPPDGKALLADGVSRKVSQAIEHTGELTTTDLL